MPQSDAVISERQKVRHLESVIDQAAVQIEDKAAQLERKEALWRQQQDSYTMLEVCVCVGGGGLVV